MAVTQADVDRLEAALASGQTSVEYDGRKVEFANGLRLLEAIAYAKNMLASQSPGGRVSHSYATFSRD